MVDLAFQDPCAVLLSLIPQEATAEFEPSLGVMQKDAPIHCSRSADAGNKGLVAPIHWVTDWKAGI